MKKISTLFILAKQKYGKKLIWVTSNIYEQVRHARLWVQMEWYKDHKLVWYEDFFDQDEAQRRAQRLTSDTDQYTRTIVQQQNRYRQDLAKDRMDDEWLYPHDDLPVQL